MSETKTESIQYGREECLERLTRAIQTCEAIHNDSRTPIEDALKLMDHIRTLHKFRRALRRTAFDESTASLEFSAAIASLTVVNETLKADVMAHKTTMEFVNSVAQASSAVLDLAVAVGALGA